MIRGDDLDFEVGMHLHEIFGRHFCGCDGSFTAIVRVRAGGVVEHAYLDRSRRLGEARRRYAEREKRYSQDMRQASHALYQMVD